MIQSVFLLKSNFNEELGNVFFLKYGLKLYVFFPFPFLRSYTMKIEINVLKCIELFLNL